jgi:hypothetical protein
VTDDPGRDGRNLIRGLPEAQHHLWKTLPDRAVVIDLGKPKVLKGFLSKRRQDLSMSRLHGGPSFAKIGQKCD